MPPITNTPVDAPLLRVTLLPGEENGLQTRSQVMAGKVMTVRRDKAGPAFGRIDAERLVQIERCLAVFLGIAKWRRPPCHDPGFFDHGEGRPVAFGTGPIEPRAFPAPLEMIVRVREAASLIGGVP